MRPTTQMHFPNLAHPDFIGATGFGEMADSLAELDFRVGRILDAIDSLGVRSDTLVIFASDNGPEFRDPWRGTAGFWRGTYHTAMEGGLRAPAILRWPGRIAPGRTSDEIVHIADLYATLASVAGASVPDDRPIDALDQSRLLFEDGKSAREGFVYYIKEDLRAAKWRDWKCHYSWEPEVNHGRGRLESPLLFHLVQDPKEETNIALANTWGLRSDHEDGRFVQGELARVPADPAGYAGPLRPARACEGRPLVGVALVALAVDAGIVRTRSGDAWRAPEPPAIHLHPVAGDHRAEIGGVAERGANHFLQRNPLPVRGRAGVVLAS